MEVITSQYHYRGEGKMEEDRGTRRLDDLDLEALAPVDSGDSQEYVLPWVVELRVVGTASVIQFQVKDKLIIGRSDPKNPPLPDIDLEPFGAYQLGVSRRHAMVLIQNNRLMIQDLGSSNGTYLNRRALRPEENYRVRHGDTITIGKLELQVLFAVTPTSKETDKTHPVRFEIPNLGKGEQILIVDDDVDVAYVLGAVLDQAGFKSKIVRTYGEAVSSMNDKMPSAVIFELILPDRSGLDIVSYVRERKGRKDVPLIVVSSITGGYQMGQAIEAGVEVFMCKPVGVDELIRGISKVREHMPA